MLVAIAFLSIMPADLVIENATLWTNGRVSPDSTIAVRGGKFVHIGEPDAALIGPETKRHDAKGAVVMPGIIDSHAHFMRGGVRLTQLALADAHTKTDFLKKIEDWVKAAPAGKWILGHGWSAESWPEKEQPTKEWLDKIESERPMALYRMDGHSVLVNSAALKLHGIDKNGPKNPEGGSIDRDPKTGEPTGLLRETAMGLLTKIPSTTLEELSNGFAKAVEMANRYGITGVSEIGPGTGLPLYASYAQRSPSMRISLYLTTTDWTSEIAAAKRFAPIRDWVAVKGLKGYMDGTLGSRTAFMFSPFTKPLPDQTSLTGLARPGFGDGTFTRGVSEAAAANLQVIFHAIGDRANHETLNIYESNASDLANRRFRVEHAQHLTAGDIRRFGPLGVIASLQPYHKADDGRYCEEIIGHARSRTSYAYRDLLDTGARLAFGSDWPVVTANPWLGIEAAVDGRIMTGDVWMPHQNISVHEALKAYTIDGAYAMGREKEIGQIAPGFNADFIILNSSPFKEKPDWKSLAPTHVWVGGKAVVGG